MFNRHQACFRQPIGVSALLPLFISILWWHAAIFGAVQQEIVTTLTPDHAVERQLAGGERHVFQVSLQAGQYLCVSVEQRGIDIELKIAGPEAKTRIETDALNSTQGPEIASIIAAETGNYRIEVVSPARSSPAGKYEISIRALRMASEQDRRWIAAQGAYLEGKRLSEGSTAEAQGQALVKLGEALRTWQVLEDRLMVAHTLSYLVSVYRDLGQTQHALAYSGYALEILRAGNQPREEAEALTTLANVLSELGESRKALEYYQQSLTRWRLFNDVNGEARTLASLGLVNSQLGETRAALSHYADALAVWQRLGNSFQAAETLTRIGLAYDNLGEWQKSLEHTTQALTIYRAIENKRGEAAALNNLGLVYGRLGEPNKAVDYYQQALVLWRTLGNRREEANTLSNIGFVEAQQNNATRALTSYQQSLKLWREAGDFRGEALVLQRMGDFHAANRDARAALEFFNQSLPLLRTAGDSGREANVLLSIANLHLVQGESAKAREFLTRALNIQRTIGNPANEAQVLFGLARAERDVGNLKLAWQYSDTALSRAETVRTEVGSQQLRASYRASVHKFYELHLDILMRLHQASPADGYDGRALQASERARARSLLELLSEARANLRAGADPVLLERADKLTQELNAKAQIQLQLASQRGNEAKLLEVKREINALEDEFNQVEANIRKTSSHYAALTQPQPLSLPGIQQQLDEDSLLLEYALGEERSWVWAVTKHSIASALLPGRTKIEAAALRFRDLLTVRDLRLRNENTRQRETRIAQGEAQLPVAARALSEIILGPVATLLENRRLVIVADGALQYVPFAALPDPSTMEEGDAGSQRRDASARSAVTSILPTPLIVKHEIITLPSATTLAVLRSEIADRKPSPKTIAVFADPVFTRDEAFARSRAMKAGNTTSESPQARDITHEELKSTSQPKGGLEDLAIQPLPYTRLEADQILSFVSKAESLKATDFAATRAAVLDPGLGQYRYLHFATHGLIDSERPGLSSLVLSLVDESGKSQDGFLRAHEIYNLKLPAELVVLSACQTGLGREYRGEGLVGLTRGFMYAGAARVVVSLWNVNDRATADLMTKFYQKMLKQGVRPAAALRAAQVEMWQQKQWQAPYYWAAFELQGEWR